MAETRGLVVDFGGVLTTHLGDAFRSFCEREGVEYQRVRAALRAAYGDANPESLVARFETGRVEQNDFERELAVTLSEGLERPIAPGDLIARMLADLRLDQAMIDAVRAARRAGIRTALLSNSWGVEYYPHDLLADLFDEVVISGEVGLRKPDPDVFRMAVERLGLPAKECLFVDDLRSNIEAGEAIGMRGVLHEDAERTIPRLEELLGVTLAGRGPDAVGTIEPMSDLTDPRLVFERRDEVQLLDVREPFEWEAGRIEGAVHIPLQQLLNGRMEGLESGKPVVIYCKTANRSEVARLMLEARGYEAHVMEGGSEAWVADDLPFTTPDGQPGRVA